MTPHEPVRRTRQPHWRWLLGRGFSRQRATMPEAVSNADDMPDQEDAHLAGQVMTHLGLDRFAAELRTGGFAAEARESMAFSGGRYIRIYNNDFTFEHIEGGEYLARAYDVTTPPIIETASRVSKYLRSLDMRHRFEVYEPCDDLACYFHHNWPEGEV